MAKASIRDARFDRQIGESPTLEEDIGFLSVRFPPNERTYSWEASRVREREGGRGRG